MTRPESDARYSTVYISVLILSSAKNGKEASQGPRGSSCIVVRQGQKREPLCMMCHTTCSSNIIIATVFGPVTALKRGITRHKAICRMDICRMPESAAGQHHADSEMREEEFISS